MSASVVVPSFNGAQRLPALLEALAVQQTDRQWEVVVVVDGSEDNSIEILKAFDNKVPLRVVHLRTNVGRAAALNAGFETCDSDVLIRCDDDLEPGPEFIERHCTWHECSDERIGVVGLCRNAYPENAYARIYGVPADARHRREAYRRPTSERWMHWAGNCSVSRSTWELIGPYDAATYVGYGWEDVDWGYRLHNRGVEVVIDPALETRHNVAAVTTAARLQRAYWSGKAKVRFERTHDLRPERAEPSAWTTAVSCTAAITPLRVLKAIGSLVEMTPHRFSVRLRRIAMKVIDLLVQSAALQGYRHMHSPKRN